MSSGERSRSIRGISRPDQIAAVPRVLILYNAGYSAHAEPSRKDSNQQYGGVPVLREEREVEVVVAACLLRASRSCYARSTL